MDIWDKVATWDIENGEVVFYDKDGNFLTSAMVDDIVEDYIERMGELEKELKKKKLKELV